jgi:predicted permease
MSCWSRIRNIFFFNRLSREIDEELESHIAEAIEQGRDPSEARRAFGSMLRQRERSLDVKLIAWLNSIKADTVFGWRQLRKNKAASVAATLSLGLTIGACVSAFRLVDALLLRPLPVKNPAQLYALVREGSFPYGKFQTSDDWDYPLFRRMREAVKDEAGLIAIRDAERMDLMYGSNQEIERAHLQYVSGTLFNSFGLRPALGRLLEASDDLRPGAHPYAVISYDYWTRRFGRDPSVIARSFRMGNRLYEIVGVAPASFTGTGPGTITDIFVPAMMMPGVSHSDSRWVRVLARVRPGIATEPVRERLEAVFRAFQEEKASGLRGMSKKQIGDFVNQRLSLEPAAAGVSGMQKEYRRALATLSVLAGLLLLIACANVANLMTAQAAARAREMALRISIGAGRWRLVQLVLTESAMLVSFSAVIGALFAWWSAPFMVGGINPPDDPARLILSADW